MKKSYAKQALLAISLLAATPTLAIDFPTIGGAPENGKVYVLMSRSNPSLFSARTEWDSAFVFRSYDVNNIKRTALKAIKNEDETWSFVHEITAIDGEGATINLSYYLGIPSGTDNLNANIETSVKWIVEEGDYPGFYKLKADEGQGNDLTIGGYLHMNAGNDYPIINESTNGWFPDYYGGVQRDEYEDVVVDESGYFPIPVTTISQNWAFVDTTLNLVAYNLKVQLYQLLQDIEDNNLEDEMFNEGFQNAINAALPYYQKADFTADDLEAARAIVNKYKALYDEIQKAIELLGEKTDAAFTASINAAVIAFNTANADLDAALSTLKAAEETYAKGTGDLTVLGKNMSFEDLSSQDGNQTSSVAAPPTGWNVFIKGQQVTTADEVKAAGITAWHGINNDSEGDTKDGEMAFGLWTSGVPEYELSQTISGLENGTYLVKAALMVGANGNGSRRTTQRIFGNLNSTYFASQGDYDETHLDQSEVYGFADLEESVTDRQMQEMSVEALVYDGTLTFGLRTNGDFAAALRDFGNSAGGDGWFKVDNFRIERTEFSADNAVAIYIHFADALDQLLNNNMEAAISEEAENILKQHKIDNNSTLEQVIAAFTAIKDIYARAKRSADVYSELEAALEKASQNLMTYEHSASAGEFGDLIFNIQDIYETGSANEEQVKTYIQQIEDGIEQLKATAVTLGDITFVLKNSSFEDLSNQNNTVSDGAVKSPKGWTLYVDGAEAETVSGGWCAINRGDAISVILDSGEEATQQPTDGDHLWGIWNDNIPEVELSQSIKNMPPGTYTLRADVMVQYNWANDNTTTQRIFANNCIQMWGTPEAYSELNMPADALNAAELTYAGYTCAADLEGDANSSLLHPMSVTFGVGPDSTIVIGFRTNGINVNGVKNGEEDPNGDGNLRGQGWFKVDNFRLSYDSEEIPTNIAAISERPVATSEIFNINGMRQTTLRRGINIVRMPQTDGSLKAKKVVIK